MSGIDDSARGDQREIRTKTRRSDSHRQRRPDIYVTGERKFCIGFLDVA